LANQKYPGLVLGTVKGQLLAGDTNGDQPVSMAVFWQAPDQVSGILSPILRPADADAGAGGMGSGGIGKIDDTTIKAFCARPSFGPQDSPSQLNPMVSQSVTYSATFPVNFSISLTALPPNGSNIDLAIYGGRGTFSMGAVVAYNDSNGNSEYDFGTPSKAGEPIVAFSGVEPQLYLVYLDGALPSEVALTLPQGFSWLQITRSKTLQVLDLDTTITLRAESDAVSKRFLPLVGCSAIVLRGYSNRSYLPNPSINCIDSKRGYTWNESVVDACVITFDSGARCLAEGEAPPADWPCE